MSTANANLIQGRWMMLAVLCGFVALSVFGTYAQALDEGNALRIRQGRLLADRLQTNASRLQQSQAVNNQIEQRLASMTQPDESAVARTIHETKALRLRLSELEKTLTEFNTTNSRASASIADLQKELADAEEQRDRLVKKQSEELIEMSSTNVAKGLRRELVLKNLEPVTIKLVKNRVVPMMEPFYSIRQGKLKVALTGELVDGVVISRVHDGESAANAIRPGGLLDTLLAKADPKKKYFRLLVCADSISAFHAIPRLISQRGFAYSWDTSNDEDVLRPLRKTTEPDVDDRGYFPAN